MQKREFLAWKTTTAMVFTAALIFVMSPLTAQQELEKPPEIPPETAKTVVEEEPLPPKIQDEHLEPTVTIRDEEDRRVEEYRINGRVYMIKVTPEKGLPYYYIDTDGDGQLELDMAQRALNPVQPVFWKIKEWK
jgi:hypothetical protein